MQNKQMIEEIFKSIDNIAGKKIENSKFSYVEAGTVISSEILGDGGYKVSTAGKEIRAYALNARKYHEGDVVLLIIPNRTLSGKAYIMGAPTSLYGGEMVDRKDPFVEIADGIDELKRLDNIKTIAIGDLQVSQEVIDQKFATAETDIAIAKRDAAEAKANLTDAENRLNGKIELNTVKITETDKLIRTDMETIRKDHEGRISLNTSAISQTSERIDLEVGAVREDLGGRITANETAISQTAESIRLSAEQITELKDGLASANAQIDINAGAITSTVEEVGKFGEQIQANKSAIEQTAKDIKFSFETTGGSNLIRNGEGRNNTLFWTGSGLTVERNLFSGFETMFVSTFPNGFYGEDIQLKNDKDYVFQAMVTSTNPIASGNFAPLDFTCATTKGGTGKTQATVVKQLQNTTASDISTCYIHIKTAKTGAVWFRPQLKGAGLTGQFKATQIMLSESTYPVPYNQHLSEMYDGIIKMDKDGIEVGATNSSTITKMNAQGYYIWKNGVTDPIFKVDANGLYLQGSVDITNTIRADKLKGGILSSNKIVTGTTPMTEMDLDNGTLRMGDLNGANYFNWTGTALNIKGAMTLTTGSNVPGATITNGTITGDKIIANEITANHIKAGSIDTGHLKVDGIIESVHIKADQIKANHIIADAIQTKHIAADQVNATHIQSKSITAEEIKADTITANEIASKTITAEEIKSGSITADEIKGGTITGDKIFAGEIDVEGNLTVGGTIEGKHIKGGTIVGDNIMGGTITGDHIKAGSIDIDGNLTVGGTIEGKHIKAETIVGGNIKGDTIEGTHIKAQTIEGDNIKGNTIEGTHIKAGVIDVEGNVVVQGTIEGKHLKGETIVGGLIKGETIEGKHIKGETIEGDHIKGGTITGEHIFAGSVDVSGNVTVEGTINARHIKSGSIESNHLTSNAVAAGHIQAGALTSDKMVIADAFIKDAMIANITAGKITSGSINTGKVSISSPNGGILISDATQQFRDKDGKVRIQMGQDAKGDFSFGIFDATGTGLIMDHTGIKEKAVADGFIKDKMIGDGEIGGDKVNMSSLITEMNKDENVERIKASKIAIDLTNQSLEVSFTEMKSSIDSNKVEIDDINSQKMYRVDIVSDNGNIFQNGNIRATLKAIVYSWDNDVTSTIDANRFRWTRISADVEGDNRWNQSNAGGKKQITVTSEDVMRRATFQVDILDEQGRSLLTN